MLRRGEDLVVGQPAHAWVSGQLARAWGNAAFPAPAPREPFCLAAEQHDVGWADADLAPLLDDDGLPRSFLAYPRAEHVAIWRGAARRLLAQSRYAALLVSLHGTSLYERIDPDAYPPEVAAAIRDYVAGEQRAPGVAVRRARRRRGRPQPAAAAGARPVLARALPRPGDDARGAGRADRGRARARGQDDGRRATTTRYRRGPRPSAGPVAPWPFAAERVVVGCEARRLAGPFPDAGAARAALAAAPWVPLRWELRAG